MGPAYIPLRGYTALDPEVMKAKSVAFREEMASRRSIRQFSHRTVSRDVIEECLRAAISAPSGANLQPWHFVVVSDPELKRLIRAGAEKEEQEFYSTRAPAEWLQSLEPLGTDANKPFLEAAPYLIAIFVESYALHPDGSRTKNYYATESVGIATGFLIAALHHAGLATLTHTPSPMGFLNEILNRPKNERPFLLLVVGHPAEGAVVPDISKKQLSEVVTFLGEWLTPSALEIPSIASRR